MNISKKILCSLQETYNSQLKEIERQYKEGKKRVEYFNRIFKKVIKG